MRGTSSAGGQIVPGDIVQQIDGKPVKSTATCRPLAEYEPGDTVTLTVWREGKTRTVRVRLQPGVEPARKRPGRVRSVADERTS